jgi:hypothetical protein
MQIFVTNDSPVDSAIRLWQVPVRARKMITETQQILACCQKHFFGEVTILKVDGNPYSTPLSRMNHPVVKWACEDLANMRWLRLHLIELWVHYEGKKFVNVVPNCKIIDEQLPRRKESYEGWFWELHTPFLNFAKNDDKELDFRYIDDVFEAYNQFLLVQGA